MDRYIGWAVTDRILCFGCAQADVDAAAGAREAVPEQRLPRAALPRAARDAATRCGPPGGPAPRGLPGHAAQPERPGEPPAPHLPIPPRPPRCQ